MSMTITVVNQSTLVSNNDAQAMTAAVAAQVSNHFNPAWSLTGITVNFATSPLQVAKGAWQVALLDDPDQADALGYHEEDAGIVSGKVFARPSLDNGSKAFTGAYAVSTTLSHEVLEVLADPFTTAWNLAAVDRNNNGTFVATEVCDPVESQFYVVKVGQNSINVSDFVIPAWFDPQTKSSYTNVLKTVTKPFGMAKGGYMVIWDKKGQRQVYGESMPQWRQELKQQEDSRGFRRTLTSVSGTRFHGVA
jgi:hypothetical protein